MPASIASRSCALPTRIPGRLAPDRRGRRRCCSHRPPASASCRGRARTARRRPVREPLVMEARRVDGLLRVMPKSRTFMIVWSTDVKIGAPPGDPITITTSPSRKRIVGHIDDSSACSVRSRWPCRHHAVVVRYAVLDAEVVHLVVEQKPGALDDDAVAVPAVQRVGVGDRVAVAVDDREMRRARALAARVARRRAWKCGRASPPRHAARCTADRRAVEGDRRRRPDRRDTPHDRRNTRFSISATRWIVLRRVVGLSPGSPSRAGPSSSGAG